MSAADIAAAEQLRRPIVLVHQAPVPDKAARLDTRHPAAVHQPTRGRPAVGAPLARRGPRPDGLHESRVDALPLRKNVEHFRRRAEHTSSVRRGCDSYPAQSGTPRIMPAPTVCEVSSSTRMKLPVARLRRYSSKKTGAVVRSVTRPISLSVSDGVASSRCKVLMSSR